MLVSLTEYLRSAARRALDTVPLDVRLIQRFANILYAISSHHEINSKTFKLYTLETAKLYVSLYPWYYMPSSVHKILIHGADIVHYALLPMGQLSEEAAEAKNKDLRKYREHHSRKCSRLNTNEDILHMLLVSSDPYLSTMRKLPTRTITQLPDEVHEEFSETEGKTDKTDEDL
ncbi:uncharacterized protein LOC132936600 [Metopolophium dirhodum]|uniref:uncharacterized protein LOC132936600 n=1 Tax=Metopolophium dirhodum TaxID=44670 RepID=UPI00298F673D|nr:uncharacterized protein LOC132936600 [Metopolophium dirhodum]